MSVLAHRIGKIREVLFKGHIRDLELLLQWFGFADQEVIPELHDVLDSATDCRMTVGRCSDVSLQVFTGAHTIADAQYLADDTLGETHAATLQARTLARLTTYADGYDIPVLVPRSEPDEFTAPVATVADHLTESERTRMGPRIVGDDFETLVSPVDDVATTRRHSRTGGKCSRHAPRRSEWNRRQRRRRRLADVGRLLSKWALQALVIRRANP